MIEGRRKGCFCDDDCMILRIFYEALQYYKI